MQNTHHAHQSRPVLPKPLSLPLKMIPAQLHSRLLVAALNRIFTDDLKNGELDFLQHKIIHITIEDAGIEYRFTLEQEKIIAASAQQTPDLVLNGSVYDYLLLASRREDTDALFFSRHLQMQGDTELGLYVKNFLDGLDMASHPLPATLESILKKSLPVYERLFGKS